MKRSLVLRREALSPLTAVELHAVNGAEATMPCVTGPNTCAVSRQFISLCGCLTDYCSVDVC